MSAIAWGASIEGDGKVVWFEPAPSVRDHDGAEPVFDSHAEPDAEPAATTPSTYTCWALDVPLYAR